jgi:hypothetical protein
LRPWVESAVQHLLNHVFQRLRKLTLDFYRHVAPPWQGIVLEGGCTNKRGGVEEPSPLPLDLSCVFSLAPCNL